MKRVVKLQVHDDGTLHLPVDNIVAGLEPFANHLIDQLGGLLPRKRPPAAVPKTVAAVAAGATNANRQLSNVDARLLGYSLRETTGVQGAEASIELRAGTDATGDLIVPVTLAGGESTRDWFGPNGITFVAGMYLVRVAGSVDGSIWLGEI